MRRPLAVLAGLGLLLFAFGVAFSTPGDDEVQAPFSVAAEVGEETVSRHLVVTVHDAQLADEVVVDDWRGTTSGVWLVVDATIQARTERSTVAVNVFVDGVRYPATGRIGTDAVDGRVADAGFPVTGSVLVELPADILDHPGARTATVRFSSGIDARLDSVIDLEFDLTSLPSESRTERDPAREGDR
ncbi:hypothetical protein [Pseudolysinimonas sp.]|jgi:hypothetical protein|uniref:hypothetical protein n=1 Tax=Pseudolysinimonas sp. TaxID=2680009 RepID=UPI003784A05F